MSLKMVGTCPSAYFSLLLSALFLGPLGCTNARPNGAMGYCATFASAPFACSYLMDKALERELTLTLLEGSPEEVGRAAVGLALLRTSLFDRSHVELPDVLHAQCVMKTTRLAEIRDCDNERTEWKRCILGYVSHCPTL